MTFAVNSNVRFKVGRSGATWVLPEGTFTGLNATDRQTLSDWLDMASGIDTVVDLAARPWNIPGTTAILGVFEADSKEASWLIARCAEGWMLTRRLDGFISGVSTSLSDILTMID